MLIDTAQSTSLLTAARSISDVLYIQNSLNNQVDLALNHRIANLSRARARLLGLQSANTVLTKSVDRILLCRNECKNRLSEAQEDVDNLTSCISQTGSFPARQQTRGQEFSRILREDLKEADLRLKKARKADVSISCSWSVITHVLGILGRAVTSSQSDFEHAEDLRKFQQDILGLESMHAQAKRSRYRALGLLNSLL